MVLTPARAKADARLHKRSAASRRQRPLEAGVLTALPVSSAITATPAPTSANHIGATIRPSRTATPPSRSPGRGPVHTVRGATPPPMALPDYLLRTAWHAWRLSPQQAAALLREHLRVES